MSDEILDIVDGHDTPTATIRRADYETLLTMPDSYIRAAEMFIVNKQGQLWIPTRTADKKIAPNGLDYSAAGHVESGEDYLTTIVRETQEEIGLDLRPTDIELVAKLKSPDTRYFRCIYLYRSEESPVFNPEDFVSAAWLYPREVITAIESGHPAKMSLKNSVVVLQNYLDDCAAA